MPAPLPVKSLAKPGKMATILLGAAALGVAGGSSGAEAADLTVSAFAERVDNRHWRPAYAKHDRLVSRLEGGAVIDDSIRGYTRTLRSSRATIDGTRVLPEAQMRKRTARAVFARLISEAQPLSAASRANAAGRPGAARAALRRAQSTRQRAQRPYHRWLGFLNMGSFAPLDGGVIGAPYAPAGPAGGTPFTDSQLLGTIRRVVGSRSGRAGTARALRAWRDPVVRAKIREPVVRAGFALLVGTVAEPAMRSIFDPALREVRIEPVPADDGRSRLAVSRHFASGARLIALDEVYRGEHPAVLSPVLAHELLHSDGPAQAQHKCGCPARSNGREEELFLRVMQSVVWMQELRDAGGSASRVARRGTRAVQANNRTLLITLNSRRDGHLAVFDDQGPLFPRTDPMGTGWADAGGLPPSTPSPGDPYLSGVLRAYLAEDSRVPSDPDFPAALRLVDASNPDPAQLTIRDMREVAYRHLQLRPQPDA